MINLHYFNPGHETAILNGSPYYMPPANVLIMQNDLAYLPAWLASSTDLVLLNSTLPKIYNKYLINNKISTLQGITPTLLSMNSSEICAQPWGLSPQVIHFFEELKKEHHIKLEIPRWNNELSHLSSRKFASECLELLCSTIPELDEHLLPVFLSKLEEIKSYIRKKDYQMLAKSPYSSSGRGLLWLPVGHLNRTENQILQGMLNKQGNISIEKALNKKVDFAMEFYSDATNINFEGYSLFETNQKGAYLRNLLRSQGSIEETITSYIDITLLNQVKNSLINIFSRKFKDIYRGVIGVDMMIYEEDGIYKLHPCLEINVRNNMGVLSLNIYQNYIFPSSEGYFYIDFNAKDREVERVHEYMLEEYPAVFNSGRIESGYLSLCPISAQTKYRAYILINKK